MYVLCFKFLITHAEYEYPLYKHDDRPNTTGDHAEYDGDQSGNWLAHYEVVEAKSTKEYSQHTCGNSLGLSLLLVRLLVWALPKSLLLTVICRLATIRA